MQTKEKNFEQDIETLLINECLFTEDDENEIEKILLEESKR